MFNGIVITAVTDLKHLDCCCANECYPFKRRKSKLDIEGKLFKGTSFVSGLESWKMGVQTLEVDRKVGSNFKRGLESGWASFQNWRANKMSFGFKYPFLPLDLLEIFAQKVGEGGEGQKHSLSALPHTFESGRHVCPLLLGSYSPAIRAQYCVPQYI